MKKAATEVTLTQAQLAAACGISQPQASRDLRAAGIEPGASGYSLADLARLAEWRALERVGASSDGRCYDVEAERGRLLAHQADLAALKLGEERGDLVRASEVGPYWCDMVASMRTRLVALSPRLAALIADHGARARFQQQADALVCEALGEIEKDGLPAAARERYGRADRATAEGAA